MHELLPLTPRIILYLLFTAYIFAITSAEWREVSLAGFIFSLFAALLWMVFWPLVLAVIVISLAIRFRNSVRYPAPPVSGLSSTLHGPTAPK